MPFLFELILDWSKIIIITSVWSNSKLKVIIPLKKVKFRGSIGLKYRDSFVSTIQLFSALRKLVNGWYLKRLGFHNSNWSKVAKMSRFLFKYIADFVWSGDKCFLLARPYCGLVKWLLFVFIMIMMTSFLCYINYEESWNKKCSLRKPTFDNL